MAVLPSWIGSVSSKLLTNPSPSFDYDTVALVAGYLVCILSLVHFVDEELFTLEAIYPVDSVANRLVWCAIWLG